MKNLILMLLFAKTVLLTPDAIDLTDKWVTIKPREPLEAITSGASLQIDITAMTGILKDFKKLEELYPKGTIEAKLVSDDKKEVVLNDGDFTYSNTWVRILLSSDGPISTKTEFVEISVRSKKTIKNAKIYWQNFKK